MRARYDISRLTSIYGRTLPPDTAALIELRLWRGRADGLIRLGRVVDSLTLIAACSELTIAYRKSRVCELSDAHRGRLREITVTGYDPANSETALAEDLCGKTLILGQQTARG